VRFVKFFDSFLMIGLRPRNKLRFPHRERVTFFARAKKVTKETRPRMARSSCASRLWPPSWRHATSLSRAPGADLLVRAPSGLSAKGFRCSGAPYGVLKIPPRTNLRCVAHTPVGASRASSKAGSIRETFDRARGALCAPGELGERPAAARRAGNRAYFARRSDRAAFSLVTFFWPDKRKSPRVQGRSHPQLAFQSCAERTQHYAPRAET